jgi:predicted component of type VI protein secretion system
MAKVHVLLAGEKVGTFPMKASPWIVGRHGTCHVQIDNPGVSRRQCQFSFEDGTYYVQDLMSANGTFIAGKKVRKAPVQNGTEINVGKYVLVFEDTGMEMAPSQARAGAGAKKPAGPLGFSGAQKTFQMEGAALRQQMAKAGAAAAGTTAEVKKAADVAEEFNLSAELGARKPRRAGKYIVAGITILGIAIVGALVVLAFYLAASS